MLGMEVAALLALVAGLLVVLLLPLLDRIARPHRAWLPAAGLLAAAALVALGLPGASTAPDRPAPANVIHLQDGATGTALWASPAGHDNAFTAAFLGGSSDTASLGDYATALRGGRYRVAPAPSWEPEPTRFSVLDDAEEDGLRRVRLRLSWDDPPMMVEVRPASDSTRLLAPAGTTGMAGHDGSASPPLVGIWRLERWGLAWPLEMVVEGPAGEPVALTLSARYPGLPALADGERPARPEGLMAVPMYRRFSTLSDVRVVREAVAF
jgi:hypothetical protein